MINPGSWELNLEESKTEIFNYKVPFPITDGFELVNNVKVDVPIPLVFLTIFYLFNQAIFRTKIPILKLSNKSVVTSYYQS